MTQTIFLFAALQQHELLERNIRELVIKQGLQPVPGDKQGTENGFLLILSGIGKFLDQVVYFHKRLRRVG